ncbi:MAG: non-ribosomal peptide synthetase, partial [Methylovulum sp.]
DVSGKLSSGGKINRSALPLAETISGAEFTAPRDPVEIKLAGIWADVLNMPKISVLDNFFDLGGHSLLAMRLITAINKAFGSNLSLSAMIRQPCLAQQAELLRGGAHEESASPLVAIKPEGTLAPLFCVHTAGGHVLSYLKLASYLQTQHPVYGLQSAGLAGAAVEELAAFYLKAMRDVQPQGPYYLLGGSSGGLIAYEMARQLRQSGEELALLALLDTYTPAVLKILDDAMADDAYLDGYDDDARLLIAFAWDLLGGADQPIADLINGKTEPDELFKQIAGRLQALNIIPAEALEERLRVFKSNRQAIDSYRPQPGAGDHIVLFSAQDEASAAIAQLMVDDWERLAGSDIRVHGLACDHYSLLQEPDVQSLARILNDYL